MRPWYLKPDRSKATLLIPALVALSAITSPMTAAADLLPVYPTRSEMTFSKVEADVRTLEPSEVTNCAGEDMVVLKAGRFCGHA